MSTNKDWLPVACRDLGVLKVFMMLDIPDKNVKEPIKIWDAIVSLGWCVSDDINLVVAGRHTEPSPRKTIIQIISN